jgi:hypothetical protein
MRDRYFVTVNWIKIISTSVVFADIMANDLVSVKGIVLGTYVI